MKYKDQDYLPRQAHARACAAKLARHVGWTLEPNDGLLPPPLCRHGYEPQAHLVLIPCADGPPYRLQYAVSQVRCTALMVEPGSTNAGLPTFYFTLFRCAGGEVHIHRALRLWKGEDGSLFLLPDPDDLDAADRFFTICRRGIAPADAPWRDSAERRTGLERADALMAPDVAERR